MAEIAINYPKCSIYNIAKDQKRKEGRMRYLLKSLIMHFVFLSFIAAVTLLVLRLILLPDDGIAPNWVSDAELLFYQAILLSLVSVFIVPIWIFYDRLKAADEQALRLEMKRNDVVIAMFHLHIDVPKLTRNQVIACVEIEYKKLNKKA
jgi:hypothetical protein